MAPTDFLFFDLHKFCERCSMANSIKVYAAKAELLEQEVIQKNAPPRHNRVQLKLWAKKAKSLNLDRDEQVLAAYRRHILYYKRSARMYE